MLARDLVLQMSSSLGLQWPLFIIASRCLDVTLVSRWVDREYLLSPGHKPSFSRTICVSLPVAYLVTRQMAKMQPHSLDVIKDLFS